MKDVSSGSNRRRTADESVSSLPGWDGAADDQAIEMAAVHRPPPPEPGALFDGHHARGRRALSLLLGAGAQRPCRRPMEALGPRLGARAAPAEGRVSPSYSALERAVPL